MLAAARCYAHSRPISLPRSACWPTRSSSLAKRLVDFIQRNPGLRVEQINSELGTTTRDVALPLRKLMADGVIRTEGEKRSTQYFPAQPSRASGTKATPSTPVRRRRA